MTGLPPLERLPTRRRNLRSAPSDPTEVVTGLSRQNSGYRRIIAVCDGLSESALGGAGSSELTEVFARLLDKQVILLDTAFGLRARAGPQPTLAPCWDPGEASVARVLRALQAQHRPLRLPAVPGSLLDQDCLVAPVGVGRSTLGYLLVLGEGGGAEPDDTEFLTLTYAATLFALTLAHERTGAELNRRYRETLVDGLVSGLFRDAQDARAKARSLGLAESQPYRVAVLRFAETVDAQDVADRLLATLPGAAVTTRPGQVIALVPDDVTNSVLADGLAANAAANGTVWPACLAAVARIGDPPYTCGVSERLDRPDLAPQGRRQAEQAVEIGAHAGRPGPVICYDELGVFRLLLSLGEPHQLVRYANDVLGPLVDYSRRHTVDLVETLAVYLQQHGSLKQTARMLGLHANTVAYRVQRIEEISGLDLGDADDRLVAHVTVKILQLQETEAMS